MNQSFQLYQLQQIDSQLDRINGRIIEIQNDIDNNTLISESKKQVALATEAVKKHGVIIRKQEDIVQNTQIKIETNEASLYSGKIQNPKELQDLQAEIQSLHRYLSAQEDLLLNEMLLQEQLEIDLQIAKKHLIRIEAEVSTDQASLLGEKDRLIIEQKMLIEKKDAISTSISEVDYALYSRLRKQKRGLAVVTIQEKNCSGCGAEIRPSERQAATSSNQIGFCSSCGRIIYVG